MILVEVKKFSKGKDGTYYIELQDNSLKRCMRIDKDGGVTVSPSGWVSEHKITKCTVDPESVAFKYIKSAFIQDGASEDDAFAFAAYVLWDLSPKANIFQEVDENVIGELVINRNISYAAEELLKAIVSYYLDCISGEKTIYESFTAENNILGLLKLIINANISMIEEIVEGNPDAEMFTEGSLYSAFTELKMMCMDIIHKPDDYDIGAPVEVIAYRAAIYDSLLQRMGLSANESENYDKDFYMNDKYSMRLYDSYPGEEGGEEFRQLVYEIADRLGVPHGEIMTFKPRRYQWYDETHDKIVDIYNRAAFPAEIFKDNEEVMAEVESEGVKCEPFTDDTDCSEFAAANFFGVPYDRGKRANIRIAKTYSSRDGFCSTCVYFDIIRDYFCIDDQLAIMVTKECLENGLNICGGSFIETDDGENGDWYLYGENQDEEYIGNQDNYIPLSFPAVLKYCDDADKVIDMFAIK